MTDEDKLKRIQQLIEDYQRWHPMLIDGPLKQIYDLITEDIDPDQQDDDRPQRAVVITKEFSSMLPPIVPASRVNPYLYAQLEEDGSFWAISPDQRRAFRLQENDMVMVKVPDRGDQFCTVTEVL